MASVRPRLRQTVCIPADIINNTPTFVESPLLPPPPHEQHQRMNLQTAETTLPLSADDVEFDENYEMRAAMQAKKEKFRVEIRRSKNKEEFASKRLKLMNSQPQDALQSLSQALSTPFEASSTSSFTPTSVLSLTS